ncbi:M2 family metallopeptidase [Longimicrobium terrae]|uniref:Peptidyl-dipeptidase A n=1 Tax=Longimicrobium terrae TaxID=1639882 RepID=A0A841GKM7_9BACT|nr:M2 family metallopeptidase [Longimicrobium terrae]MBB4634752.1 peptidyl-dipeptidase A [Longimicrobium terrae]MBB6069147.1 peptidyl-dipeptidase A [Longimicrobium terrae]NNC32036.1 M2 family metallopeptidase [Longimicrobium terrae]
MQRILSAGLGVLAMAAAAACAPPRTPAPAPAPQPASTGTAAAAATPGEAAEFIAQTEAELRGLSLLANQAGWTAATFITVDTEAMSAEAQKNLAVAVQVRALAARRFDDVALPADQRRKLNLLKLALVAPPPGNPEEAAELSRLQASMGADYGRGQYCRTGGECLDIGAVARIMATSRNEAELRDVWRGWNAVGAPMRPRYTRFVELSNKGAAELGHRDTGAMWRAGYDMPADEFSAEVERLWQQVRPLYVSLHAYVRQRLAQQYGPNVVPANGLIPAHLLGNVWAQEWGNIYPLVAPRNAAGPGYDLTELIEAKKLDAVQMTRFGERFFTSMGFDSLPATFWQRSQLVQPADHEVVCHASAWDIDDEQDVRIKMCITPTAEDFVTIHHELGHNFYQRAYRGQPMLFRNGANDGFHEAIGDAVALSITPDYLRQVGLLNRVPPAAADTALLLRQAMDKVAFLPFGLMVDKWRWGVFSGEITPANYNAAWWELRNRYQGIAAPVARSEADFDPGAKYHIPANTPYMRYFLARVLQFQFYRSLCREAGYTGPLHRCSFYGSKAAGAKLQAMLEAGQSRPWQETLYLATGERTMDAGAMLEYFAPLKEWLDRQNQGKPVGW